MFYICIINESETNLILYLAAELFRKEFLFTDNNQSIERCLLSNLYIANLKHQSPSSSSISRQ